ncbi:MAG: Rid family hydrolase [Myxococcota bacterium]
MSGTFVGGIVVPTMPHPLLTPDANPGYRRIRDAYDKAADWIAELNPDVLVLFSTRWPSVIGHQIQADPEPVWTHVDQDFHALGSIPYHLRMDADLAEAYSTACKARGLHTRTVAYKGFPIDTGSIVALKLLDPNRRFGATITSCNMYSDRAETLILGKSAADAVEARGQRAVAVAVTQLSNRWHPRAIDPAQDRFSSLKDDEWNRKLLEFFQEGRLEDVSQLARTFTAQANGDSKLKAIWWMAAAMGQTNNYAGEVLAYEPVHGAGCAVITLAPASRPAAGLEFDEADADVYQGDRNVLATESGGVAAAPAPVAPVAPPKPPPAAAQPTPKAPTATSTSKQVHTDTAAAPVGPYPHARREGEFIFLSGMGPRRPGTGDIPGGPIHDAQGVPQEYDVTAQTHAVFDNIEAVLKASGASIENVVDCTCFLVDMDRDFKAFNAAYKERIGHVGPTRTTLAIRALPTPIAVELKVVARITGG